MGHRLQRAEHGVRQHGQPLRHRRGLQPQPGHRREQVLRRVAGQRTGRGRGGRHPHAQPDQRSHQERAEQAPGFAGNRHARALQGALRYPHQARTPLQGHAGYRVHDPGGQALHAAVPQRQADRHRGLEHGHGHAQGRPDRREDRRDAGPARAARRIVAPDRRPGGREEGQAFRFRSAGRAGRRAARSCSPRPRP